VGRPQKKFFDTTKDLLERHDEISRVEVNLNVADSDVHVFASGDGHQPRLTNTDRDSTLEAAQ
jgi:multiple sugar transport system ATP-binding protein